MLPQSVFRPTHLQSEQDNQLAHKHREWHLAWEMEELRETEGARGREMKKKKKGEMVKLRERNELLQF